MSTFGTLPRAATVDELHERARIRHEREKPAPKPAERSPGELVSLSVGVPPATASRLRSAAEYFDMSVSGLVREVVAEWLDMVPRPVDVVDVTGGRL